MNILDKLDQEIEELQKEDKEFLDKIIKSIQELYDGIADSINKGVSIINDINDLIIQPNLKYLNSIEGRRYKNLLRDVVESGMHFNHDVIEYINKVKEIIKNRTNMIGSTHVLKIESPTLKNIDFHLLSLDEIEDYINKISSDIVKSMEEVSPLRIKKYLIKLYGTDVIAGVNNFIFFRDLKKVVEYYFSLKANNNILKLEYYSIPSGLSWQLADKLFEQEIRLYRLFLRYSNPENYNDLFLKSHFAALCNKKIEECEEYVAIKMKDYCDYRVILNKWLPIDDKRFVKYFKNGNRIIKFAKDDNVEGFIRWLNSNTKG